MFDDCIIMAGGSGTRLWPASSSKKPKQFLPSPSGGSFFQDSVRRALEITDPANGRIIIVSGKSHVQLIADECAAFSKNELKRTTLIPEPLAKNTAAAIACGLIYSKLVSIGMNSGGINSDNADRNVIVLTCDHIIEPIEVFKANAATAKSFAKQDKLVIFGITPKSPDTGYGYIETGEACSTDKHSAYKVLSFREKPDLKTAELYLNAGNYFWNSGMFAFSSKFMLNEFRRAASEVINPFNILKAPDESHYNEINGLKVLSEWPGIDKAYAGAKAISFDYAIAEKCAETVVIKAEFNWTDIGNWDEYIRLENINKNVNSNKGDLFQKDSGSVFVDSDIPVALIGADDLIVVIRSGKDGGPAAALIAKKGETQKVKDIVNQIKSAGRVDLT